MSQHKINIEKLAHFLCQNCQKWWSISDIPEDKMEWFCPWCGEKQIFSK